MPLSWNAIGLFGALPFYFSPDFASVTDAVFESISGFTPTGYATADYELFPGFSQVILFACMFMGASAGSTGGGMKIARGIVCFNFACRELFRLIHPRSIRHVKLNQRVVSEDVLHSIMGFLALYMMLFAVASTILAAMGLDLLTSLGQCRPAWATSDPDSGPWARQKTSPISRRQPNGFWPGACF